jgi:hypothetical protein
VLTLHFATNLKHETIAEMREAAQTFGDRAQKRIAILHLQRPGGGEHNVQLGI